MSKKLKFWNGRGHGKYDRFHICVAAYSQKQAAELVGKACGLNRPIGYNEIRNYYSQCWGTNMQEAVPDPKEPCVYVETFSGIITKVL